MDSFAELVEEVKGTGVTRRDLAAMLGVTSAMLYRYIAYSEGQEGLASKPSNKVPVARAHAMIKKLKAMGKLPEKDPEVRRLLLTQAYRLVFKRELVYK